MALSLITPEEYNAKRFLLKKIEDNLHAHADRIVYGTKSLFDAELCLFPDITNKAYFSRVSCIPDCVSIENTDSELLFGYFGNYYSGIRNIKPLVIAFQSIVGARLIVCGSSDIHFDDSENTVFRTRIPQIEVEAEEAKIDVEICLLNKTGIQIPGKLFYHTNLNRHILVILDGPKKTEIMKELLPSNRFIFCENNEKDIKKAIEAIMYGKYPLENYDKDFYSSENVANEVIGKWKSLYGGDT